MSWTQSADLRAQVQKLWDRGELLASLVTGEALFPKRLMLRVPTSPEMSDRFDEVREWIVALRTMPHCRVEMREIKHRVFGSNAVPREAWIDTLGDALALIGKRREAARFVGLIDTTSRRLPQLLDWLAKRPLRALELSSEWELLLEVVVWLQAHPRPGVYLRQVDISGVHSKFIEAQRGVLAELLDIALPADVIDPAFGASQFAKRYGFRDKPMRIRFRVLDPKGTPWPDASGHDVTLDAASFAQLNLSVTRVFITENEINFLSFPQLEDSLIIFGAGYGFETLLEADWLSRRRLYYWGDIDTHGFAILDQLRNQFAHVVSFLMDRNTLLAFATLWGEEEKQSLRDLPRLNPEETALYNDLRDNRIRKHLRLEQEMIGFSWVESALSRIVNE